MPSHFRPSIVRKPQTKLTSQTTSKSHHTTGPTSKFLPFLFQVVRLNGPLLPYQQHSKTTKARYSSTRTAFALPTPWLLFFQLCMSYTQTKVSVTSATCAVWI